MQIGLQRSSVARFIACLVTVMCATCSDVSAPPVYILGLRAPQLSEPRVVGDTVAVSLLVRSEDLKGVRGVHVTFTPDAGSVLDAAAITGEDGVATTRWVLGSVADTQTIRASISEAQFQERSVRPRPGRPARVQIPGDITLPGLLMRYTMAVQAWDRFDNPLDHTDVQWISRDPNVAAVSLERPWEFQSKSNGVTWIVAQEAGLNLDSARVTVRQAPASILLDSTVSRVVLIVGDTVRLKVLETRDYNGQAMPNGQVSWMVDDSSTLSVNSDGIVTALRPGVSSVRASGGGTDVVSIWVTSGAESDALQAKDISVGFMRACAVQESARALCWGAMLDEASIPPQSPGSPAEVVGGGAWRRMEPGWGSTCGMEASGSIVCFRHVRHYVAMNLHELTGGMGHTCGLDSGRRTYCWQVPNMTISQNVQPTVVDSAPPFRYLAGTRFHGRYFWLWVFCGIDDDSAAWCWGHNNWGQLGRVAGDPEIPGRVDGGHRFRMISPGPHHTCGLTEDDIAYCWGNNLEMQLGFSTDTLLSSPGPQRVATNLKFASIQVGMDHTCAVTLAGAMYCWGSNFFGQLGDGTLVERFEPRPVAGNHVFRTDPRSMSLGISQSCGITVNGALLCWGSNQLGQLGLGAEYFGKWAAKPAAVRPVP